MIKFHFVFFHKVNKFKLNSLVDNSRFCECKFLRIDAGNVISVVFSPQVKWFCNALISLTIWVMIIKQSWILNHNSKVSIYTFILMICSSILLNITLISSHKKLICSTLGHDCSCNWDAYLFLAYCELNTELPYT